MFIVLIATFMLIVLMYLLKMLLLCFDSMFSIVFGGFTVVMRMIFQIVIVFVTVKIIFRIKKRIDRK